MGYAPGDVRAAAAVTTARSFSVLMAAALCLGCFGRNVERLKERELAEVQAAVAANLAALRERDVEAYLAGYLDAPDFIYLGPDGVSKGFAAFADARRTQVSFPDSLEAGAAELTWVAPGVVHVTYPVAARLGSVTGAGWLERVFVRTTDGWKIAVTGFIPAVGGDRQ